MLSFTHSLHFVFIALSGLKLGVKVVWRLLRCEFFVSTGMWKMFRMIIVFINSRHLYRTYVDRVASVQRLPSGWTVRGSSPVGGEIFRTCPDRPWGPPSLLYSGYWVFPEGKVRPGRDADPSPPSSAEVKNRVELYLYSPWGPSWPMKGWNLYRTYCCMCVCVCVRERERERTVFKQITAGLSPVLIIHSAAAVRIKTSFLFYTGLTIVYHA